MKLNVWNHFTDGVGNLDEAAELFGVRAVTLARLSYEFAPRLRFSIPKFAVISNELSHQVNTGFSGKDGDAEVFKPSNERMMYTRRAVNPAINDVLQLAQSVDSNGLPIIRSGSHVDGLRGLSFAGVFHTVIPRGAVESYEHITNGLPQVIAGSFTSYTDYYFRIHNIPEDGKNVAIMLMELVNQPVLHAAAYIYNDMMRVKYFIMPTIGAGYVGGHELLLNFDTFDSDLPNDDTVWTRELWLHLKDIFQSILHGFYNEATPFEVEFLVSGSKDEYVINIVQQRKISSPHVENYRLSSTFKSSSDSPIVRVHPSHLFHSVGETVGGIIDLRDNLNFDAIKRGMSSFRHPVFVLKHDNRLGTARFLRLLPFSCYYKSLSVIITHPELRSHDHQQYVVFEDQRIKMVIHCSEEEATGLRDGMMVHIVSNGQFVYISESTNMSNHDEWKVVELQPDKKINDDQVSAVFVFIIKDGQILTITNRIRGIDIPGGHIDPEDKTALDALNRELYEEARARITDPQPLATIDSGREKQMLFYFATDAELDEFTANQEVTDRGWMAISDFLSGYHQGNEQIMRQLLELAQKRI